MSALHIPANWCFAVGYGPASQYCGPPLAHSGRSRVLGIRPLLRNKRTLQGHSWHGRF